MTMLNDDATYNKLRSWSIVLGIGMVVLGIITISLAAFTTYLSIILLGIVLAIRGIIDIVTTFTPNRTGSLFWHLFGGILSLCVGILVMSRPGASLAALTYLLAAFLIIYGLFKTIAAPVEHDTHWGWVMLSGIVSLIFGVWLISVWPEISIFLIGLLIGIEIVVQGIVMISLPFTMPRKRKGAGEAYAH